MCGINLKSIIYLENTREPWKLISLISSCTPEYDKYKLKYFNPYVNTHYSVENLVLRLIKI